MTEDSREDSTGYWVEGVDRTMDKQLEYAPSLSLTPGIFFPFILYSAFP